MHPAKTLIRLRKCAVWSESLLDAVLDSQRCKIFFMRTTKTLIRPRGCAGWFESSSGAHVRRTFSHVATQFKIKCKMFAYFQCLQSNSVFIIFCLCSRPCCWNLILCDTFVFACAHVHIWSSQFLVYRSVWNNVVSTLPIGLALAMHNMKAYI